MNRMITGCLTGIVAFSLLAACTSKPPPKPVTHWRVAAHQWAGNRVLMMPVDSRVAIFGKCPKKKQEKVWRGAIKTGDVISALLPDYLQSRGYEPAHFMTWSGKGMDQESRIVTFLSPRQTARIVYSLSHFSQKIDTKTLQHRISPDEFRHLAQHADATLYTASWSVMDFRNQKSSLTRTVLYTGAIILGVAIVTLSILAIVGGKDGADILIKGLEAGGRVLAYAGRGFFQFFTRVPVKAVLQSMGRAAAHTAEISARVVTRTVIEGGVHIEIPLEHIQPIPMDHSPVVQAEEEELTQLELMSNSYLGILHGVSSLQPTDLTPGYHMALVLLENRTGTVVWDAHIFIPQNSREKDFQPMLQDLFRSMPSSGVSF